MSARVFPRLARDHAALGRDNCETGGGRHHLRRRKGGEVGGEGGDGIKLGRAVVVEVEG